MSKASQRKRSSTSSPFAPINPNDLMLPVKDSAHALRMGKAMGMVNAIAIEEAWKRYTRQEGAQLKMHAHAVLDEDMSIFVKPYIEAMQSSLQDTKRNLPDEDYNGRGLPFISGSLVIVWADRTRPWRVKSLPHSAAETIIQGTDNFDCINDIVARELNQEPEVAEKARLAFWFTSAFAPWTPFMVCAVHINGASGTYTLGGEQWAKGPPFLMPYRDSRGEKEALLYTSEEAQEGENLMQNVLKIVADPATPERAQAATLDILTHCFGWGMAINQGTCVNQISLARQSVKAQQLARQCEAELNKLRKEHEQAERKARKGAVRVAELEKELDRVRGLLAKKAASTPQAQPGVPPTPAQPLRSSLGERMGVFFG